MTHGVSIRDLFGWRQTEAGKAILLGIILVIVLAVQLRVVYVGLLLSEEPLLGAASALSQIETSGAVLRIVERYGAFACAAAAVLIICKSVLAPPAPHAWPTMSERPAISRRELGVTASFSLLSIGVFGLASFVRDEMRRASREAPTESVALQTASSTERYTRRQKRSIQSNLAVGFHRSPSGNSVVYVDLAKRIHRIRENLPKDLTLLEENDIIELLKAGDNAPMFHDLAYGVEETALGFIRDKRWNNALQLLEAAIVYDLSSLKANSSRALRGGIGRRGRPCLRIYDLYAGLATSIAPHK
jgi:hypothetical protein